MDKITHETVRKQLSFISKPLLEEIINHAQIQEFEKGAQILRDEQYIKFLPIVLNGVVKVFSNFGEKELLLYYIQPNQSCVMTFSSAINNKPSRIYAITEEASQLLLIPVQKLATWLRLYPDFSQLFYNQYDLRYTELLETIQHILIDKIDQRLFEYLKQRLLVTQQNSVKLTHNQIAIEMGTAREVVSRALKKLENQKKIIQETTGIKILV